jgi:hypothetical protein
LTDCNFLLPLSCEVAATFLVIRLL